jgi:hypothetical protein
MLDFVQPKVSGRRLRGGGGQKGGNEVGRKCAGPMWSTRQHSPPMPLGAEICKDKTVAGRHE